MRHGLSIHDVSESLLRWRVCESGPGRSPVLIRNVNDIDCGSVRATIIAAIVDCAHRNGSMTLTREVFDGMHRFVLRDARDMGTGTGNAGDILHATKSAEGMAVVLLCVILDDNDDVLTTEPVVREPQNVPHEG